MSLYAFAFTFILPYLEFYAVCAGHTRFVRETTLCIVLGPSMLATCTLAVRRIGLRWSLALMGAALAGFVIRWVSDDEIKTVIAEVAGAFDGPNPLPESKVFPANTVLFVNRDGGYSLRVPETWQRHQLETWGFSYF